jgi:hypothetical protein
MNTNMSQCWYPACSALHNALEEYLGAGTRMRIQLSGYTYSKKNTYQRS